MAVILNAIKTRAFGDTAKELVPEIRRSLQSCLSMREGVAGSSPGIKVSGLGATDE